MRYHFILHYGWFFQNLGKETFMHTTVAKYILSMYLRRFSPTFLNLALCEILVSPNSRGKYGIIHIVNTAYVLHNITQIWISRQNGFFSNISNPSFHWYLCVFIIRSYLQNSYSRMKLEIYCYDGCKIQDFGSRERPLMTSNFRI